MTTTTPFFLLKPKSQFLYSTELLIEGLGRASPIEEPEACIYGYGAVRFLASMSIKDSDDTNASSSGKIRTKTVSQRLVRQGAMQLMILHLQLLNEFVSFMPDN